MFVALCSLGLLLPLLRIWHNGPRYVVAHHCRFPLWHMVSVRLWQLGWFLLWLRLSMVPFVVLCTLCPPGVLLLALIPVVFFLTCVLLGVGHVGLRAWRTKRCILMQRW